MTGFDTSCFVKNDSESCAAILRRFRNQISAIPQPKSDTLPQPKKGASATKKEPIPQPKIRRFRNQKKAIPQPKQEDFATKKRPFPNHHPHDSETSIRVTIAATVNIASSPNAGWGGVGWGGVGWGGIITSWVLAAAFPMFLPLTLAATLNMASSSDAGGWGGVGWGGVGWGGIITSWQLRSFL